MTVPKEFEPYVDGLVIDFYIQRKAMYEILTGGAEPSGLLPFMMPADMETVETHCEDLPFDMTPYKRFRGPHLPVWLRDELGGRHPRRAEREV